MILRTIHIERGTVIWCLISLAFMILSFSAMIVFWHGVKRAAGLNPGTFRRQYALDVAWVFLLDELWRFTQHLASFFAGMIWFFVTYIPPPQDLPNDVKFATATVIFVLFYVNVASGINTIRSLRTWRRREKMLNLRYPKPKDRIEDHD